MTDWKPVAFGTILIAALLGLTNLASRPVGETDIEGAVAAALIAELEGWAGEDGLKPANWESDPFSLCVEAEVELDFARLAADFQHTVVRPIPVSQCTSRTITGDFGMFTELTDYFDPSGDEAGQLAIPRVTCVHSSECLIDIDGHGSGYRYRVRRHGSDWVVSEWRMRWIV